jgi:hypothetical protein
MLRSRAEPSLPTGWLPEPGGDLRAVGLGPGPFGVALECVCTTADFAALVWLLQSDTYAALHPGDRTAVVMSRRRRRW